MTIREMYHCCQNIKSDAKIVIFNNFTDFCVRKDPVELNEFIDMTETVKNYKVKLFEADDNRTSVYVLLDTQED